MPVILAGTFMVVLDFFIVNVALPSIQSDLHASASAVEWVVAGYAVTSAVFLVSAARLGDRIGRRRTFSAGLALFTLSSACCGVAASPTMLVAARLAQGVSAALLTPNVLSLIGVLYGGEHRVRALSAYGMTMGVAAVGGQLIGGALVQLDIAGLGWRTCFLINVPIGALALALAPALVPESREERPGRVDLRGTALVTAGITAIVLPLVEGRAHGWPTWTWLSLAAAPVFLLAFALQQRHLERRGGSPLLPPTLFAQRTLRAGLLAQLVFWSGQASFFLVFALYLQEGRGLSPLHAGLIFTILAASYLAASLRAPALAMRHGRRVLTAAGLVLACGHGVLALAVLDGGVHGSLALLAPGLVLVGAGMGLAIAPLATIVMSATAPERAGAVSGALTTMQNVGNAIGVAIIGVIYFGALHSGATHAFALSLGALAAILLVVVALTRLLPSAGGRS